MSTEIPVPDIGDFDSVEIIEILVKVGDVIKKNDCMSGIPEMINEVQVEATFPDGTKLVTVHHPIR